MNTNNELEIKVDTHVPWAVAQVRKFAEKLGFEGKLLSEIELCASELSTNLVVHRVRNGKLIFIEISENGLLGIELTARDEGPGIKDVKRALQGGASTSGSLGQGLSSVQRLADEFELHSDSKGTIVRVRKYLPSSSEDETFQHELNVSVAVRTHPESNVCGDGHVIRHDGPRTLIAVIDGLGHGEKARKAAAEAEAYLHANYRKPLDQMPEELHSILRHTRGAVMGIARIDEGTGTITFTGVGNISARLWKPEERKWVRPVSMSGTLGVSLRTPKVFSYLWTKGCILIMHSDGIREHWDMEPADLTKSLPEISRFLIENYWRKNDDATALVAR